MQQQEKVLNKEKILIQYTEKRRVVLKTGRVRKGFKKGRGKVKLSYKIERTRDGIKKERKRVPQQQKERGSQGVS